MERRQIAESALKHLCERIGVPYTTESEPMPGAWFLDTIHRNSVNIYCWGDEPGRYGVSSPLGSYGQALTHEQVYDRCWFADRCFTAWSENLTHAKAAR